MSVRPLKITMTVTSRGDADSYLKSPGDAVLVERGSPRWLVMKCPCGCGEVIPINLDGRSGPAWEFYPNRHIGDSVFPSVWRDTGCQSHFIVWYGRILLFDGDDGGMMVPDGILEPLVAKLKGTLSDEPAHYRDLAQALGAVPWDVEHACRQLVGDGYAVDAYPKRRGFYKRSR
jgi:Family of unknown function (DUF6527)